MQLSVPAEISWKVAEKTCATIRTSLDNDMLRGFNAWGMISQDDSRILAH